MKIFARSLLALSVVLTVAACNSTDNKKESYASTNNSSKTAQAEDDGQICKMEKKIGSNRMTRVCYTAKEREQMEEASRDGWLRTQRSSSTGGGDM
ncbi:hypothetical protein NQT74_03610 [Alteromonas stellipolaris]|uniref:hypothetical protein n=1 Tax=Alteromonas stellipolaris TaxID=233316 RepID=UPI0021174BD7|nr:hypothetical protein [Alteromonas stellipolaris]MCQ8847656.1 hypothetical protein [Alteromonas stellipolaris]